MHRSAALRRWIAETACLSAGRNAFEMTDFNAAVTHLISTVG
jgi:hypothetical protein